MSYHCCFEFPALKATPRGGGGNGLCQRQNIFGTVYQPGYTIDVLISEKLGYDMVRYDGYENNASGFRPKGKDQQMASVPVQVNQPLMRSYPKAATGRDKVHGGPSKKH